ncbi:hypothetical protein BS47DRAFT_1387982 [Hydnum rufescens UP504]|uniref:Uncharacterized protein n=1 Tax=Hydnum rufescens UP504 TaxID=1448309 RepID=A0A9P6B8K7_9AGAM|nr:hypothetical protein BS47DRAFT_1387982 [Hydnum rufescens UP504]
MSTYETVELIPPAMDSATFQYYSSTALDTTPNYCLISDLSTSKAHGLVTWAVLPRKLAKIDVAFIRHLTNGVQFSDYSNSRQEVRSVTMTMNQDGVAPIVIESEPIRILDLSPPRLAPVPLPPRNPPPDTTRDVSATISRIGLSNGSLTPPKGSFDSIRLYPSPSTSRLFHQGLVNETPTHDLFVLLLQCVLPTLTSAILGLGPSPSTDTRDQSGNLSLSPSDERPYPNFSRRTIPPSHPRTGCYGDKRQILQTPYIFGSSAFPMSIGMNIVHSDPSVETYLYDSLPKATNQMSPFAVDGLVPTSRRQLWSVFTISETIGRANSYLIVYFVYLLMMFKASCHPAHSESRVRSTLFLLNSLILALGLLNLDLDEEHNVTTFIPNSHRATKQGCSFSHFQLSNMFPSSRKVTPLLAACPGWREEWDVAETRREEQRGLVWSVLTLTYHNSVMYRNLCIAKTWNFRIFLPGKKLLGTPQMQDDLAAKHSVWALFSRCPMLYSSCLSVHHDENKSEYDKGHPAVCDTEKATRNEFYSSTTQNLLSYQILSTADMYHIRTCAKENTLAIRPYFALWSHDQLDRWVSLDSVNATFSSDSWPSGAIWLSGNKTGLFTLLFIYGFNCYQPSSVSRACSLIMRVSLILVSGD